MCCLKTQPNPQTKPTSCFIPCVRSWIEFQIIRPFVETCAVYGYNNHTQSDLILDPTDTKPVSFTQFLYLAYCYVDICEKRLWYKNEITLLSREAFCWVAYCKCYLFPEFYVWWVMCYVTALRDSLMLYPIFCSPEYNSLCIFEGSKCINGT